jgi:hypothetical protein
MSWHRDRVEERIVVHGKPPQALLVFVHWSLRIFDLPRFAGASSLRGEIHPRRVDRALQEPNLHGTLDRLTARRDTELAVLARAGLR